MTETNEDRAMAWMDEHERGKSSMYPHRVAIEMSSALNIMPKEAQGYVLAWLQRFIREPWEGCR
uniref:Uncharacterized protein n=1 Tax=viral metagenome TaxID=1070528 RepID=A0A6M3LUA5_9ZZZZ